MFIKRLQSIGSRDKFASFTIPESDWLQYDKQIPGGVRLSMRNDPLLADVVGYFYEFQPAHGAETFAGDPLHQVPPDGWLLNHFWYGSYWIRMIKVGQAAGNLVTPLTQSYCEFTVGPTF